MSATHDEKRGRDDIAPYEYRGLMAEAWDVLRGDTSQWPDRFFYREAIERYGQPVLDVGCGTGRLLLDYIAQGIDIDGVDNSPEMLALCQERARAQGLDVALYEQYMEELDLPRRYRAILVPSSSLQLITDREQAAIAMVRLVAHLEPGGALVASFMTLWREGDPLDSTRERSAVRPEDGALFRHLARARYDPATRLEHTDDLYQRLVNGVVVAEERHVRSPATLSYTQQEAIALYENAGLTEVRACHEFTWEPARSDDTLFTVLGMRPPSSGDRS